MWVNIFSCFYKWNKIFPINSVFTTKSVIFLGIFELRAHAFSALVSIVSAQKSMYNVSSFKCLLVSTNNSIFDLSNFRETSVSLLLNCTYIIMMFCSSWSTTNNGSLPLEIVLVTKPHLLLKKIDNFS